MGFASLFAALGVGLAGGASSGLLGVSPGGALVVFSVLLLGEEQHVAQGLSLIAQIPPSGLAGLRHYRLRGFDVPRRWIVLLLAGYLVGGALGALAAGHVGARPLRWIYVAYLAALNVLLIVRGRREASGNPEASAGADPQAASLLVVGFVAGLSSGFLGIGGGLATTVGLTAWLGVAQHRAQMASLTLSLLPATALPAWVYWREGWLPSWPLLLATILGLQIGADLGARLATRASGRRLQIALMVLVAAMTVYMAYAAILERQ